MTYKQRLGWAEILRAPDQQAGQDMDFATSRGTSFSAPVSMPSTGIQIPPRQSPASQAPFARLIFPPRIEKLPTSTDFHVQDYQMAIPAVVGSRTTSTTLRFQLPETSVGFLQQIAIYVLAPLATTRLSFQFRINQGPIPGFDNILNPPGAANLVLIFTNDIRVRLPAHCLVDVVITNLDGAAVTAGGDIAGWYHPVADELRMFGPEGTA